MAFPLFEVPTETQHEDEQQVDEDKAARVEAYEEKKTARIDRLRGRADKARERSTEAYERSRDLTKDIPFGQPILVGHHSEGRHRATLRRSHAAMDKSCEEQRKAEYWDNRAAAAESNNSISSDDPAALDKLRQKLAGMEATHVLMVAANKCIRKNDVDGLKALGLSDERIQQLMNPRWSYYSKGYQTFELSNSNANIKRVKKRIAELESAEGSETKELTIHGVRVVDNIEENRLQLIFNGKPSDEVRAVLKRNAFRWSPRNGAWQRQRSGNATYAAKLVLESVKSAA